MIKTIESISKKDFKSIAQWEKGYLYNSYDYNYFYSFIYFIKHNYFFKKKKLITIKSGKEFNNYD